MPPHTTLVTPETLAAHLADPAWQVVDVRFDLSDAEAGRRAYRTAHIPSAAYAHLNDDLSSPVVPGRTGRHPLPEPAAAARTFGRLGIGPGIQVVAYDDSGGAVAARLWWMLRWLGHDAVAVLDGGWPAWTGEDRPVRSGEEFARPRLFEPRPRPSLLADADLVERWRTSPAHRVLDARNAERFRGEVEPIDPVAGHIPGARSAPYAEALDEAGRFVHARGLRARFEHLLEATPAERVACYCGSGVTAAHLLLALAHAGLGDARLYAGSWSEWITDPARPVATEEG